MSLLRIYESKQVNGCSLKTVKFHQQLNVGGLHVIEIMLLLSPHFEFTS